MNYKIRNPVAVILFSFITCGLYFFYWIYVISDELRYYNDVDSVSPGLEVLLSIICLPYVLYWFYKYSRLIYIAQHEAGIEYPEDNSILHVILAICGLGCIAAGIMQISINKIWRQHELNKA